MDFNEDFLQFIWQFRLLSTSALTCAGGEALQVLNPGVLNKHAGPDFSGARLLIDHTTWIGHVEIHLKSSDWIVHGHQHDNFYDTVILHVVYEHDHPVYRTNGSMVPVLVLKGLFSDRILNNYSTLILSTNHFPCEKQIGRLDQLIVHAFLSRIIMERLEQKSEEVFQKINHNNGDWEQTFYSFLGRNFGFKVNAVPFEMLTTILPHHILAKHKDNALQIEALLFGQAGFLKQAFQEDYPKKLQSEYAFLSKKYKLVPMDNSIWKFLRMRPQNFPTIRLAQFAALMVKSAQLFSKILKAEGLSDLYVIFNDLPVNEYWLEHYHFNKKARQVRIQPGRSFIDNLIINSVCLFLFSYGRYTGQPGLAEQALDLLEKLPAEHNAIVSQYLYAGIKIPDAFTSQGLLHLNKCYCNQKKCLNCAIGIKILKK